MKYARKTLIRISSPLKRVQHNILRRGGRYLRARFPVSFFRSSCSNAHRIIILLSVLALPAVPAQSQQSPGNVVECLLSLPAEIGPFHGLPVEERKQALAASGTVIDKKNGYVSFETSWVHAGWTDPYTIQVAVFRRKGRHFIVGVSNSKGESLGDRSMIGIEFHELVGTEWKDVTAKVIPQLAMSDFWTSTKKPPNDDFGFYFLTYDLPRVGTTIAVDLNVWIRRRVDDGQQDISTDADRARYEAIESAVNEGSRRISLVWNAEKGVFKKKF